ncbi:MAG: diguanylate cyclase [Vallitaleaceae bacterium]|nr:diguanylate cyclase [Vallitaleaceae bacterium]
MKKRRAIKSHSIRRELLIPLISTFISVTAFLAVTLINESQNMVDNVLVQLRDEIQVLIEKELTGHLNEATQLNALNQEALSRGLLVVEDQENREKYFSSVIRYFPDVTMTYYGQENGFFYGARRNEDSSIYVVKNDNTTKGSSDYYSIDSNGTSKDFIQAYENFDPRVRPWYKSAVQDKTATFGSIYSHFILKEPTLTASFPNYVDGVLTGVFGVDFQMTWLGETLKNLPIGEHGLVFVVDDQNQLVASTMDEPTFKMVDNQSVNIKVEESMNPLVQQSIKIAGLDHTGREAEIKVDHNSYLLVKTHYQLSNIKWNIYIVLQRNDFLKEMRKTLIYTVLVVIGISILFIGITVTVVRRILNPIARLSVAAKRLQEGVFEEIAIERRQNELDELTHTFNDMGRQITSHVSTLKSEVHARTLELEEKNRILKELSYTDQLMDIANKRKFDETAPFMLDIAKRNENFFGIIMLDIDNFKNYNDTYGHIEGDNCLKEIGKVLRKCANRKTDLVARYGGEEIVISLIDNASQNILNLAENIRRQIQELGIENRETSWGVVTVSIGITYGKVISGDNIEALVDQADKALYLAKENGKNRIEVYKP